MARRSTLRASDNDRECVADRLRLAAGEGRLLAEELEERLEGVFSARTYGELNALVADLPVPAGQTQRRLPVWVRASLVLALVMGVLSAAAIAAAIAVMLIIMTVVAWVAWVTVSWAVFGRGHRAGRAGHTRHLAQATRYARAGAGVTRAGRSLL